MTQPNDIPERIWKGEQRAKFAAAATVNQSGQFEIIAITEGQGNGWNFSAAVLKDSLKLWDGVNSCIDHAGFFEMPSVLKLCGVGHSPTWSDEHKGVKLNLKPFGPMASIAAQLATEILAARTQNQPTPNVGFSGDIGFKAKGRDVIEITRVFRLDLVLDPARGGDFIAALSRDAALQRLPNQGYRPQESPMNDKPNPSPASDATASAGTPLQTQLQQQSADIASLAHIQAEQQKLADQVEAGRQVHVQMCATLLSTELAAAKLPGAAADEIRAQFADRVFKPEELQAAIVSKRKLVAELSANRTVFGPGRISGMYNEDDQIQAAVDDLFEVERDEKSKNLKVARLTGIRELYLGLTGDLDFYGALDLTRALFQHTTASFPGLVKNAMNKAIIQGSNQMGAAGYDWWKKITRVEHFDDVKQITWLIFGTIASLPVVAEGGEYTELKIGDGPETSLFVKYGGYIGITIEALINDDTRKLRAIPRELGKASMRNKSALVAAIFTSNSAVGPTMADTGALFNATVVTTLGGHANLLTTALGTVYTAWEAAAAAMYNQPMLVANEATYYGTGKKLGIDPKFCLVPRALKGAAEALFMPRWASSVEAIAAVGGPTYGGQVVPVTVPEWTDATDWAAVADPLLVPGICMGEAFGLNPEIFVAGNQTDPAMFANDESRIKVREFTAVGVANFRGLHKSNVAG